MKALEEIKVLMSSGDTVQADEALKELLAQEPDNLQAKMLYGTCRQLLGDEETFRRIHDELAPSMERMEMKVPKTETVSLWKKYHALWMTLIVGGLVLTGLTVATVCFSNSGKNQMYVASQAMVGKTLYGGPRMDRLTRAELIERTRLCFDTGSYPEVIKAFHEAQQAGYVVTREDVDMIDKAYKSRMRVLDEMIKKSETVVKQGREPIRALKDIEDERSQLIDWYTDLKAAVR